MGTMARFSQSHSIAAFKKIKGYCCRKKNVLIDAEDSKEFLFPIRMFSFNVYRAMYGTFDNFHIYFYTYIIVQILLKKKNTSKSAIGKLPKETLP